MSLTISPGSVYDPAPSSDALLAARRTCSPLDGFPGHLPKTLRDAYAVQARSVAQWPDRLVGFKVGGIPTAYRESYGGTWLAGPIFGDSVRHVADGEEAYVTVYDGGFAAYEAEYVFRVQGLESLQSHVATIDDAVTFVEAVHIGAEIASSPMALINEIGPGAIISDFGNNAGLVIGPEAPLDVLRRIDEIQVTVDIDGSRIGKTAAQAGEGGPLGALRFFLNHVVENRSLFPFEDALWVSSGAVTGVHSSHAGTSSNVTFEGLGKFTIRMVPRDPL